ncbi:MAG TPA: hypothetical protein VKM55_27865 [Candidatus Lokiarchaeia archaeon]|nr:hypothetical protein [Candidatus Lokiarchaeia archaeon]
MVRSSEFISLLQRISPYHVNISYNFITMERDGREFLIDAYSGDLFASPKSPGKHVLEKIQAQQCKSCFYHVSPEATFDCYSYISEGYVHPVRICVVTDFPEAKMNLLHDVNVHLSNIDLSLTQLKILSMIVALGGGTMIPADIQQKIDQIPSQKTMHGDACPFYSPATEMKKSLIIRNISRHRRKRHFLDVLRDFQYLKEAAYYTVGISYFDRKIAELESQLVKLQAK